MDSNAASRQALVSELYIRISKLETELIQAKEECPDLNAEVKRLRDEDEIATLKMKNQTLSMTNNDLTHDIECLKIYHSTQSVKAIPVSAVKVEGITITVPLGTKINVVQG